jgi:hypothetical protein
MGAPNLIRGGSGPPSFPAGVGAVRGDAETAGDLVPTGASERMAMSDNPESNDERPCLHCLIGDLIDEFYAEYGSSSGEKDTLDVDEIMTALAKTVAEITYGCDAPTRQRILDDLVREVSEFEAEYANTSGSEMRH